jgi:hypothetical protein
VIFSAPKGRKRSGSGVRVYLSDALYDRLLEESRLSGRSVSATAADLLSASLGARKRVAIVSTELTARERLLVLTSAKVLRETVSDFIHRAVIGRAIELRDKLRPKQRSAYFPAPADHDEGTSRWDPASSDQEEEEKPKKRVGRFGGGKAL